MKREIRQINEFQKLLLLFVVSFIAIYICFYDPDFYNLNKIFYSSIEFSVTLRLIFFLMREEDKKQ